MSNFPNITWHYFGLMVLLLMASTYAEEQYFSTTYVGVGDGANNKRMSRETVVSYTTAPFPGISSVPVRWTNGVSETLVSESATATIVAMNSSGVGAGWVEVNGNPRAAIWTDEHGWQLIPGVGTTWSQPATISETGEMSGLCIVPMGQFSTPTNCPFTYTVSGGATVHTSLAASTSTAKYVVVDRNSSGTLLLYDCSTIGLYGSPHYIWTEEDGLHELTGFPGDIELLWGISINEANQVLCTAVGTSLGENRPNSVAMIWALVDDVDVVLELGTLGGIDSWGFDLNDNGVVVGMAQDDNTNFWPVIWTTDGMDSATIATISAPGLPGGIAEATGIYKIDNEGRILVTTESDYVFLLTPIATPGSEADLTPPEIGEASVDTHEVAPFVTVVQEITDNASGVNWDRILVFFNGIEVSNWHDGDELNLAFDFELPWGTHTIRVIVWDVAGNVAHTSYNFGIGETDETDPVIDQTVPYGDVLTSTPEISARISDSESWVNWVTLEAYVDEAPVEIERTTYFSPSDRIKLILSGPVSAGAHTVDIVAYDNAGNMDTAQWTFTYVSSSAVASQTPTGFIDDNTPTIGATLSGSFSWNDVYVLVDYEEVEYSHNVSTGAVAYTTATLDDGEHAVTVAGVTWKFSVDTQAPTITAMHPTSGATIYTTTPTILIAYHDDGVGIDVESIEFDLTDGVNSIDVTVTDDWGVYYATPNDPLNPNYTYTATFSVTDLLGHIASTPISFSINVTTPYIMIDYVIESLPATASARVFYGGVDVTDECSFSWTGPAFLTSDGRILESAENGSYEFTVTVTNNEFGSSQRSGVLYIGGDIVPGNHQVMIVPLGIVIIPHLRIRDLNPLYWPKIAIEQYRYLRETFILWAGEKIPVFGPAFAQWLLRAADMSAFVVALVDAFAAPARGEGFDALKKLLKDEAYGMAKARLIGFLKKAGAEQLRQELGI